MSYILDALRRAESERERSAVPGLHTQPLPRLASPAEATGPLRRAAWPVAAVVALLLLGVLAWRWMAPDKPVPTAKVDATLTAPPAASAFSGPPAATPAAPTPQAVTDANAGVMNGAEPSPLARAPVTAAAMAPALAAPAPTARTPRRVPIESAAAAAPRVPKPALSASAAAPALAATPAPVARSVSAVPRSVTPKSEAAPAALDTSTHLPALRDLPEDIRKQIPQLTNGGAMYSPNPASRLIIINGQVMHEGDTIAPGLTLEQIRLKSAVLNFKGTRYEISF